MKNREEIIAFFVDGERSVIDWSAGKSEQNLEPLIE